MSDVRQQPRPSASSRCPFCHAEVDREREAWAACHGCLAPHHEGCWREAGRCAGCGEARSVGAAGANVADLAGPAPADRAPGPRLELELRGRVPHFEGLGALRVPVSPDAGGALVVVVHNHTDAPARLGFRHLPRWLRATGTALDVAPGKSVQLGAVLDDPVLQRQVCGGEIVDGTLVVGADEAAREVALELVLAPAAQRSKRRRRLALAAVTGAALALYLGLLGHVRAAWVDALAARGVGATAHVTRLTPKNHNQMYFEFEAEGGIHELHDYARGERVGDPIEVTYLPGEPDVAVRGTAYETYSGSSLLVLPFVVLMFATIALVITALAPPRRAIKPGSTAPP